MTRTCNSLEVMTRQRMFKESLVVETDGVIIVAKDSARYLGTTTD